MLLLVPLLLNGFDEVHFLCVFNQQNIFICNYTCTSSAAPLIVLGSSLLMENDIHSTFFSASTLLNETISFISTLKDNFLSNLNYTHLCITGIDVPIP